MAFHASALGDYLFLSRRRYGVDIWNFSDAEHPAFVSNLPFFDARMSLPLNDQALLIADSVMGTAIVDWSAPAAPRTLCHLAPKEGMPVTWIEASDTLIAIAEGSEISIIPREDFFPPVVGSGAFWFLR